MADREWLRGGALYVYGGRDFRYGVQDNADIPGHVDLLYEEWDTDKKVWTTRMAFECLSLALLTSLVEGAKTLIAWEKDLPLPETITIMVESAPALQQLAQVGEET